MLISSIMTPQRVCGELRHIVAIKLVLTSALPSRSLMTDRHTHRTVRNNLYSINKKTTLYGNISDKKSFLKHM